MVSILDPVFDEDLTISGNNDPADEIKSICHSCGRANGEHSLDCDVLLDSLLDMMEDI